MKTGLGARFDGIRTVVGVLVCAGILIAGGCLDAREAKPQTNVSLGEPSVIIGEVDGEPQYTFSRIGGVRLIGDLILVADGASAELRMYDRRGRFQQSSGRKGSGPGEYYFVKLVPNRHSDSVVVFDQGARRITFLDRNGTFGRTVQLPLPQREAGLTGTLDVLGIDQSGRIITLTQPALLPKTTGMNRRDAILGYVPGIGGNIAKIATFSGSEIVFNAVGGNGTFSRLPFLQDFTATVAPNKLYYVEGPSPVLLEMDLKTGTTRQVRLPLDNKQISAPEYERWFERELLTVPEGRRRDTRQYYQSMYDEWTIRPAAKILIDDSGRIWVEEFTLSSNRQAVIYSPNMRLLATFLLPPNFSIAAVRQGSVAGVVTDSNGVERVEVRPLVGLRD